MKNTCLQFIFFFSVKTFYSFCFRFGWQKIRMVFGLPKLRADAQITQRKRSPYVSLEFISPKSPIASKFSRNALFSFVFFSPFYPLSSSIGNTESLSGNPAEWNNTFSFVVNDFGNSFSPAMVIFSWNVNSVEKGTFEVPLIWLVGGGKLEEIPIGPNFLSFKYEMKVRYKQTSKNGTTPNFLEFFFWFRGFFC